MQQSKTETDRHDLSTIRSRLARFRQELQPNRLIPTLTAGLICGVLLVIYAISMAALVFSGQLSAFVSIGIGLGLFTSVVVGIVVAMTSTLPGVVIMPQDTPAVILALIVSTIATQIPATTASEDLLATILITIAFTTLLTGIACFLLGTFKLGNLTRFIPYPVIGGFLAGVGYLLAQGAFNVITDRFLTVANLNALLQPPLLVRWVPGAGLALLLLFTLRRYRSVFILPGMILGATVLFYLTLLLTGTSLNQAREAGLLLQSFPQGSLWQPLQLTMLSHVHWHLIAGQLDRIGTVILLSVVSLLLISTGIELAAKRDMDLNQELRAAGIANVLAGLGGGMVGFQALGVSTLSVAKIGARSRWVGVLAALVCAVTLFSGERLVSLFPKPVLGGVVLFLGLSFLLEWLYDAWFKLAKIDYLLVVTILGVIATVGFLQGVAVGLVIAIALFILKYSRIPVTRHIRSGSSYLSNRVRPLTQTRLLRQEGDQIYILELQGFLFFGTANTLLNQVRQRASLVEAPLRFILLDFRLVNGLDASAILTFGRMQQLAADYPFQLICTHLDSTLRQQLQQGGFLDDRMLVFPDLERAVAWCEEEILAAASWRRRRSLPLRLQLDQLFPDDQAAVLIRHLEEVNVEAGATIFRAGDPPGLIYFVESGQLSVLLELGDQHSRRLQILSDGAVLGEAAFYSSEPHTVTVIAEAPSTLYRFSQAGFAALQQESPDVAIAFQTFLIRRLSDRISCADQEIKHLLQ